MIEVLGRRKGRCETMREEAMLLGGEKNQEFCFDHVRSNACRDLCENVGGQLDI